MPHGRLNREANGKRHDFRNGGMEAHVIYCWGLYEILRAFQAGASKGFRVNMVQGERILNQKSPGLKSVLGTDLGIVV